MPSTWYTSLFGLAYICSYIDHVISSEIHPPWIFESFNTQEQSNCWTGESKFSYQSTGYERFWSLCSLDLQTEDFSSKIRIYVISRHCWSELFAHTTARNQSFVPGCHLYMEVSPGQNFFHPNLRSRAHHYLEAQAVMSCSLLLSQNRQGVLSLEVPSKKMSL